MRRANLTTGTRLFTLLIVATAAAGLGLCYLLYGGLSKVEAQVQKREAEVGDEKTVRQKIELSSGELDKSKTQVKFLEQSVTDAWYVPTMVKQLAQSATASHLTLVSVRPQPAKKEAPKPPDQEKKDANGNVITEPKPERKPYQELDVQIAVTGSFWDLMRFLKNLNTFPKIVSVKQIQMSPHSIPQNNDNKQAKDEHLLDVQMTVRAFVFPPKPGTPAPAGDNKGGAPSASVTTSGV